MKKIFYIFLGIFTSQNAFANQPVDWQLGFQKAASESMREIVAFHDKLLLPIIIAISVFVLFLMLYACVRFRASANPNPSKRTHNVTVEVLWTLIPCLILIVMAVPSFKILYKQDTIPKADLTIKAIGYQWYWGYEYPDENIIFDSYMIEEKDLKGKGYSAIVHLAALSNDPLGTLNEQLTYDINYKASAKLATVAKKVGIKELSPKGSFKFLIISGTEFDISFSLRISSS